MSGQDVGIPSGNPDHPDPDVRPTQPRYTRADVRRELLADADILAALLEHRQPQKKTRFYESAALIGFVTLVFTSLFSFGSERIFKKDDAHLALIKTRLDQSQATVAKLGGLISGVLIAAEDRSEMAKGHYDDLGPDYLKQVHDSADAADRQWRVGRAISQNSLQFYFAGDTVVLSAWDSTSARLQRFADCAETIYRKYFHGRAPAEACLAERDTAMVAVQQLNDQLLRGYQRMERF